VTLDSIIREIARVDERADAAIDRMELDLLSSSLEERARLVARLVERARDGDEAAPAALEAVSAATGSLRLRLAGRAETVRLELARIAEKTRAIGAYGRAG